jgi:hypothetical protein
MSSHIPVNHHLRPLYRTLAAIAGIFSLVFGIVGIVKTSGESLFHRGDVTVMGLRTNLAFAIISVIVGAVVLAAAVIGGNLDHYVNMIAGIVYLVSGLLMMCLLQTTANFLNFHMSTCIVSFIIGIVLLAAGLYGRVGPPELEASEEHFRLHHGGDPDRHAWAYQGAPPRPAENHPDGHRFA